MITRRTFMGGLVGWVPPMAASAATPDPAGSTIDMDGLEASLHAIRNANPKIKGGLPVYLDVHVSGLRAVAIDRIDGGDETNSRIKIVGKYPFGV